MVLLVILLGKYVVLLVVTVAQLDFQIRFFTRIVTNTRCIEIKIKFERFVLHLIQTEIVLDYFVGRCYAPHQQTS